MKTNVINRPKLKRLSLCVLAALAPQVAFSQEAEEKEVERIAVVGSNIKINRDTGALPVTTVGADDIENSGALSGDELLAEIPQVGDVAFNEARTVAGINDARGDVSSINLRGIGSGNTLTLLNGRRLVLHPGTQTGSTGAPEVTANANTLPVKGLKRVEVLRDGAGAVYGSDAVAGVLNYVLQEDYQGSEISARYGTSEGTNLEETSVSGITGFSFNDDKSNLVLSFSYLTRDGMPASERDYAATSDLRNHPRVPAGFEGSAALFNEHQDSPWLEYRTGRFGSSTRRVVAPSAGNDNCVDDQPASGLQPGTCIATGRAQRYNRNVDNSLISDLDRASLYGLFTHELTDDLELFAEGIYYYAESTRQRNQAHFIGSQGLGFFVEANAFYNPTGERIRVESYRPVDAGPRTITVEDDSYRALVGLRGYAGDWDWETAALYSKAESDDTTDNWVMLDEFAAAVNSTNQATAYNLFSGGDLNNLNGGDSTLNSQSVIDAITDSISKVSETELALVDFKASTPALFELPMGEVAFAGGVEFRRETFTENLDPRITTNFANTVTGAPTNGSRALGNSPTVAREGSRNTVSAYIEFYVPLLTDAPFAESVDLQLAARYEDFSDINDDILKPKAALSWVANEYVQFRASYAESFKAPALPIIATRGLTRSGNVSDPVTDRRYGVPDIRSGSEDLKPEEATNKSFGVVLNPTENFTFTADWWQIEQEDVIGLLVRQVHVLDDALLRGQGSSSPLVIRDADNEIIQVNNNFLNLLPRKARGLDFGVYYDLETDFGSFDFKVNAAKLLEFSQDLDPITQRLVDATAAQNPALDFNGSFVPVPGGSGSLIGDEGNPEWRVNGSISWKMDNWGAGISGRYISKLFDPAIEDDNGNPFPIEKWFSANAYVNYSFESGSLEGTKVTFGIRNLADREPPIADSPFGYLGNVHSARGRYFYLNATYKF